MKLACELAELEERERELEERERELDELDQNRDEAILEQIEGRLREEHE
jgi:hypothetical protein